MLFKSDELIPLVEAVPEEGRLVRRARRGDSNALLALYDVYGDDLYRYVYFRVLSDVAAEAITSQVFRHAWDHIEEFRPRWKGPSFAAWIYEIARTQVLIYYKVNLRSDAFDMRSLLAAADYRLSEEAGEWSPAESWGNHLRLLTGNIEQSRLQATAALIMREYLDYLNPRTTRRPSPTFNAYTRTWLVRYLRLHEHLQKPSPMQEAMTAASSLYAMAVEAVRSRVPRPDFGSMALRLSPVYAILIFGMMLTGTAEAQTALPGDALYGWKRTSEQVWLTVSPDPVGTELVLADRRLKELIAVEHDPTRSATASATALHEYMNALVKLNTADDTRTHARILPVLEAHKKKLKDSGLANQPLYTYLQVAVNTTPAAASAADEGAPTSVLSSPTARSTGVAASATTGPTHTLVPPTATEVPPTATASATLVPPTATEVPPTPTVMIPTPTALPPTPTEILPTPTELPPTATELPTQEPTNTPAPTDAPPPTDTPVSTEAPIIALAAPPFPAP